MQIKGAEEIAAEGNPQITPLPTLTYPPKPTEKFRSKDGWSRFSKIKKGGRTGYVLTTDENNKRCMLTQV